MKHRGICKPRQRYTCDKCHYTTLTNILWNSIHPIKHIPFERRDIRLSVLFRPFLESKAIVRRVGTTGGETGICRTNNSDPRCVFGLTIDEPRLRTNYWPKLILYCPVAGSFFILKSLRLMPNLPSIEFPKSFSFPRTSSFIASCLSLIAFSNRTASRRALV